MVPLALVVGFLTVFAIGVGTGAAIMRARYRSEVHFKKAIEDARLQGRLDRGEGRPGLEPPPPWPGPDSPRQE
ncbi:hypothetical protein ACFXP7_11430 [Microbacterium sp. P06]|uniref:hypothetical protein n=1 Tax=unclassified Microbacterium TaxID=2609290 RepID=UPI0037474EA1